MSDRKYIKVDRRTGCLAFFDTERHAAIFAADCPGADYEKLVLYSCPQPAEAALLEAFDAGQRTAQAEAAVLVDALEEIVQWVGRWAAADHPVATVARKALAAYRKQGGEE